MAINPKMLSKFNPPALGGADPMLDSSDMGYGDEEGALEAGEEVPGPMAEFSDEDLLMEAQKRGLKVEMPEEAAADDLGMDMAEEEPSF